MKQLKYFVVLILAICLCACGGSSNLDELLELGAKYLDEQNYEEAIIAFEQAIKIDNKCAQAYIGLADAYICTEEYDKAEEILKKGYELTGAEIIKEMLDSLESGQIKTSDGLVRRMNHYNEKNELDWYHTYTYDNQDRKSLVTSFDGNGKQTGQVQCEYDEQGNALTRYYCYKDGTVKRIKWEYDKNGNIAKETYPNGWYTVFEYDENGKQIGSVEYYEDGEMMGRYVVKYEGNLQIEKHYDGNGNIIERKVIEFDENGRMISSSSYSADNSLNWKMVYSYDKDGKPISETEYDGNGNITGKTEYDK
ncbi:MAG: tetratricopeptide repeat protein [Anaerovoracaceae bacterium]